MLVTPGWGISFPLVKAITLMQEQALPGASSWFYAAHSLATRFAGGAIILLLLCARHIRHLTWSEAKQGIVMGLLAGAGMFLQYDGLSYTSASVSAFLTQFYVVLIPLSIALWGRKAPSARVWISVALVISGVALLAEFDPRVMHLGRGEGETLLATGFFAAQILYLQKPEFANNNGMRVTAAMFTAIAVMMIFAALYHARQPSDLVSALQTPALLQLMAFLILVSTVLPFVMMNVWQQHVGATEASLIYSTEPIYAGLAAIYLPAWMSGLWGIEYSNESFTLRLLCGGALIFAANVLAQWPEKVLRETT